MIKKVILAVLAVIVLAAVVGAAAVMRFVSTAAGTAGDSPSHTLFAVDRGESFSSVARRLSAEGFVEHPRAFKIYAWARRYDRRIKAGIYRITRIETPRDILDRLVVGDIHKVDVTVPEGYMHVEIARALAADTHIDSTAFANLFEDPEALEILAVEGPNLEGYLFPDTYSVPWGISVLDVAGMMVRRLDEVFDADMRVRARAIGLSRHEVLTLASIVQAETRLPKELPLVSAVYHNRLRRGMRLEADPTVAYAKGGYRGRLYFKDLEIESPYNTYRYGGLPPGPICAAGKAAIHATLYPDSACKAIYFVAEGNGGHIFSLTLKDHLAAVRRVRASKARITDDD
ncbi:MAG: endolytic transglycosylase MltG [Candidatus Latescibacterota bacterium]|nr:MAG: endolytic transglycosylase MltG [Candidatus Latescibacterota bacterium]